MRFIPLFGGANHRANHHQATSRTHPNRAVHTKPIPPANSFKPAQTSFTSKSEVQTLASQKQFASLIAGGIAGSFSATITCPMEVVKTHLQASKGGSEVALAAKGPFSIARGIARAEGFKGFFRGLLPTLVGILPARATYFWAYATTKSSLSAKFGESPVVHMLSAAAAGISSNTLTNPIWLMKSRVQLQAGASANNPMVYRGYRDAMVRIFREEGIQGFFKGLTASYWGVTEGALHFVVYERIKAKLIAENRNRIARGDYLRHNISPPDPERLTSIQYLTAAAVSKLIASMATYPHEVVRLRMREQPKFVGAVPKYRGMIQSLRLIAREEGRKGLYAGMGTHLARVVPNAALMFFTYEVVVKWIEKRQENRMNTAKKIDDDKSKRAKQL
ncbi:Mitochondrial carrier [Gracilaria domingensis]|nr:Mitochondrial carrier [Gracilaria domingensis]